MTCFMMSVECGALNWSRRVYAVSSLSRHTPFRIQETSRTCNGQAKGRGTLWSGIFQPRRQGRCPTMKRPRSAADVDKCFLIRSRVVVDMTRKGVDVSQDPLS